MGSRKQRHEAAEDARTFPIALAIPILAMVVLLLGGAGTFAGVRVKRREQRDRTAAVSALVAMVPAAALAVAGLLGIATLRRRGHDVLPSDDAAADEILTAGEPVPAAADVEA
jgi:hypothetical protein